VTLQDFDRLQQEFNTLGDILACLAAGSDEAQADDDNPIHPGHKAVAAISIADLKHRLMREIESALPGDSGPSELDVPPDEEEVIY
jgi:hypothetical protein